MELDTGTSPAIDHDSLGATCDEVEDQFITRTSVVC
jgi:hypothetical protein